MDLNTEFAGRVAFVSGAASGIGRATALMFARRGARVACVDIARSECIQTAELIRAAGSEALAITADLGEPAEARRAVAETIAAWRRIDHAFNNAGITGSHEDPFDLERVELTIRIDLLGVIYAMKLQVEAMLAQGSGTIVNTASIAGISGSVGALDYTAAKHGVVGLTGAAARKYGAQGLRVNAVCPGVIQTGMTGEVEDDEGNLKEVFARLSPITGKLGEPDDIAEAVLFLSSDRAKFIQGIALSVDGGFSI